MTASGRVDLVGNAGGEQADGAELVGLGQLRFKRYALGDVVDQDDAAHGDEVAREQRRNGDVGARARTAPTSASVGTTRPRRS